MMENKQLILNDIIAKAVSSLGFEFVGCEHHAQGKHSLLRVYIDSSDGITIDDCVKASRQISALLDVEALIKGEYRLEVSSPGIDRPLFGLEQYRQFIGGDIKVYLQVPLNNQRNFNGKLLDVIDDSVIVDVEGQAMTFAYSNIRKANLLADTAL